jgi:hypothetical protein
MEKPPIIEAPGKDRRKRGPLKILVVIAIPFMIVAILIYCALPHPPKESDLIQSFYKNRAAFEKLRDMLKADQNLARVAPWGVETIKPFHLGNATGVFPADRYQQYLTLLHQVGSDLAFRNKGEPADPGIDVWAFGWAGDTKHIDIIWMDEVPTNQVTNLDRCRAPALYGNRQYFYRQIEGNWYLDTDMRPY